MEPKQPSVSERNVHLPDLQRPREADLPGNGAEKVAPDSDEIQHMLDGKPLLREEESSDIEVSSGRVAELAAEVTEHFEQEERSSIEQVEHSGEGTLVNEVSIEQAENVTEEGCAADLSVEAIGQAQQEEPSFIEARADSKADEQEGDPPLQGTERLEEQMSPTLAALPGEPAASTQASALTSAPSGAATAWRPEPRKKKRRVLMWVSLFLGLVLLAGALGGGYYTFKIYKSEYDRDMALAKAAVASLQHGGNLLMSLVHNPLGIQNIAQARTDFSDAHAKFLLLSQDLKTLPSQATSLPVYGSKLQGAIELLPVALEATDAGVIVCDTLHLVISRLYNSSGGAPPGLSTSDMQTITGAFQQIKALFAQVTTQIQHLPPGAQELDPRMPKLLQSFHAYLPKATALMQDIDTLLPVLPTLLGVGTPANYLLEVLDSTELRPGGGFIGNFGIVTISNGRENGATINDVSLLDRPFEAAGHTIPYPAAYRWFDIAPDSWSLRDANLDADFPTAARYSEQNYQREGGKVALQGVFAITPALIQHVLTITGPISVPEYHETVTADNLISRIHYHQLGASEGSGAVASDDGLSSKRKHFTALLEQHLLERLRQTAGTALPKLMQLLLSSLQSKDVQIYLNSPVAESYLQRYEVDSAIRAPASGDSLFVVDANIAPSKANQFIITSLDDRITLDEQGDAVHHTTLRYAWTLKGPIYGSALYRDYVRVYTPPGSVLSSARGWSSRGTSSAFGRTVWAGFFTLTFGKTAVIQLEWKVPRVATARADTWHYQYLLQRQAGTQWHVTLQVTLPSCARTISAGSGSTRKGSLVALALPSLSGDKDNALQYIC